jgi:putative SOS response-associated peptidase YedK
VYREADCRPTPRAIIIVTDADALTEPIHVRMPVVLEKANIRSGWRRGRHRASKARRRRSPSRVVGVAALQQDWSWPRRVL